MITNLSTAGLATLTTIWPTAIGLPTIEATDLPDHIQCTHQVTKLELPALLLTAILDDNQNLISVKLPENSDTIECFNIIYNEEPTVELEQEIHRIISSEKATTQEDINFLNELYNTNVISFERSPIVITTKTDTEKASEPIEPEITETIEQDKNNENTTIDPEDEPAQESVEIYDTQSFSMWVAQEADGTTTPHTIDPGYAPGRTRTNLDITVTYTTPEAVDKYSSLITNNLLSDQTADALMNSNEVILTVTSTMSLSGFSDPSDGQTATSLTDHQLETQTQAIPNPDFMTDEERIKTTSPDEELKTAQSEIATLIESNKFDKATEKATEFSKSNNANVKRYGQEALRNLQLSEVAATPETRAAILTELAPNNSTHNTDSNTVSTTEDIKNDIPKCEDCVSETPPPAVILPEKESTPIAANLVAAGGALGVTAGIPATLIGLFKPKPKPKGRHVRTKGRHAL